MPIWLSDNREQKKVARDRVFACGPRKSVLLLPGFRCECVKLALERGVIREGTACTFIERDEQVANQIDLWMKEEWTLPLPPILHRGELATLEMHPIDLGYIDLFGNLTKLEVEWVQNQLIPNLMPGCDLAFTFSVPIRGNDFMKRALTTMNTKYIELYRSKLDEIEGIDEQARPVAAFYDILFGSLLADHQYEKGFWTYKDGKIHTMLLVTFTNIHKNPERLLRDFHERRKSAGTTTP